MDIGKYIGKFLIKNNYCSLSGLGVFELKKTNATVNNADNTVSPPTYSISFTPVGSIDDSFASFIANHENVSISNASNNIKEYCIKVKEQLSQTGSYTIDHLGKLSSNNNKITFQQSSDLDMGYEPVALPIADVKPTQSEVKASNGEKLDFSYPPSHTSYRGKPNFPVKYLAIAIAAVLVLAGAYFGYDYYQNNANLDSITPSQEVSNAPVAQNNTPVIDTNAVSARPASDTNSMASTPAAPALSPGAHRVAIFTFTTESAASAKANKLNGYGNKASVSQIDSSKFVVAIEASHPLGDTVRLVDSLRKFFNPKGNVYILK
jgi:nucleoid DNA-binding protein